MPEDRDAPEFDQALRTALGKAAEEFNAGRFFECHDTLEEVWQGTRGPARDFLQGWIQISVGFYHLSNGNLGGGASQLEKGLAKLQAYGNRYAGMDLVTLCAEVAAWLSRIRRGEEIRGTLADLPKVELQWP